MSERRGRRDRERAAKGEETVRIKPEPMRASESGPPNLYGLSLRLDSIEGQLQILLSKPQPAPTANWLGNVLQGVTLVTIVGFAFWLGTLSNKITEYSARVDKLYGLTLESRDALSPRIAAIEVKLDTIEKKLDAAIEKKVNTSLRRSVTGASGRLSEAQVTTQHENEGH